MQFHDFRMIFCQKPMDSGPDFVQNHDFNRDFQNNLIFFEKLFHSVAKNVFLWKIETLGMNGRNIGGNIFLMKIFIFSRISDQICVGRCRFFVWNPKMCLKIGIPQHKCDQKFWKNENFHQKNISGNITSTHPQSVNFS